MYKIERLNNTFIDKHNEEARLYKVLEKFIKGRS